MVAHVMPTIPWIAFGILEPILCVGACFTILVDPHAGLRALGPSPEAYHPDEAPVAAIVSLANVSLLMAGAEFVCCYLSREVQVARAYICCLIVADLGHIFPAYKGVGPILFMNPAGWNAITALNIWGAVGVIGMRVAYLAGVFGEDNQSVGGKNGGDAKKRE
ncbi:hypothetical protein H072_5073 [Dactylellina haptotyla CBS 200.50]|uniref:DUF7704 domain-containing protein n=1 Tax=Dactylellina haptotyla (strain CBS 200.50) TaxID=1284197 RepID=S8BNJ5_DACHA|nr:hypothetical protein H072_5073 [Dactylellina haptotyla CBS 200.50]